MPNLPDLLSPLVGVPISETFALLLVLHVLAGLTSVATGLVAIGQLEASWADWSLSPHCPERSRRRPLTPTR